MKKILCLCLLIATSFHLYAQKTGGRNIIYMEVLGNGLGLSANYERALQATAGWSLHAGIGLGGDIPAFPMGIKYHWQFKNKRSGLEAGAGITLAEADLFNDKNFSATHNKLMAAFIPSFGYRHQTTYGFMWRVNYTPFFTSNRTEFKFFGISLGWRL